METEANQIVQLWICKFEKVESIKKPADLQCRWIIGSSSQREVCWVLCQNIRVYYATWSKCMNAHPCPFSLPECTCSWRIRQCLEQWLLSTTEVSASLFCAWDLSLVPGKMALFQAVQIGGGVTMLQSTLNNWEWSSMSTCPSPSTIFRRVLHTQRLQRIETQWPTEVTNLLSHPL